ncbi:hypothetical protein ASC88_16815 [Rhizobacter sp. Root29]|nr:hypothetical protein ASC88_16815 [Rhizobacter sp. Root29]
MRCSVTRDIPAVSAAVIALMRSAFRCTRMLAPSVFSKAALASLGAGARAGMVFLILIKI